MIGHEANASEAEHHHCPRRELGDGGDRPEQSIDLPVNAVSKEQSIGITGDPVPEGKRPKAARAVCARVNRDGAFPFTGDRVECINLAGNETEVADKEVTAEFAETCGGESDTPGRRELAA